MVERPTLRLSLRTPMGELLDEAVVSLTAEDATGRFGVRPLGEELLAALVPSLLYLEPAEADPIFVAVGNGMLRARRERVEIAVRDAVVCSSPDAAIAELDLEMKKRSEREKALTDLFRSLERSLMEALLERERSP